VHLCPNEQPLKRNNKDQACTYINGYYCWGTNKEKEDAKNETHMNCHDTFFQISGRL
jgi:hypothetical protein